MLVQARDGWFYRKPVLYGKDSLATCHDYGAHVCVAGKMGAKTARTKAGAALREMEITGKLLEGEGGKFIFGQDYKEGWKFDFVFRAPIEVPKDHDGKTQEPSKDQSCVGFWSLFWENEVVQHVQGSLVLPLLQRALLGEWIDGQESLLKRRLYRQWSDIRNAKSGLGTRRRLNWVLDANPKEPFTTGIKELDEDLPLD